MCHGFTRAGTAASAASSGANALIPAPRLRKRTSFGICTHAVGVKMMIAMFTGGTILAALNAITIGRISAMSMRPSAFYARSVKVLGARNGHFGIGLSGGAMKHVSTILIRIMTALLVIVGAVSVFNRLASGTSIRAQSAEDRTVIVGPDHWVEFAATYVHSEQGRPPIVGRLFRGPDGSERLESGPSLDEPIGITIKNIPTSVYYVRDPQLGWQGHPMDQPEGPTRAARKSLFSNTAAPLK
jgi:hypothetical protein